MPGFGAQWPYPYPTRIQRKNKLEVVIWPKVFGNNLCISQSVFAIQTLAQSFESRVLWDRHIWSESSFWISNTFQQFSKFIPNLVSQGQSSCFCKRPHMLNMNLKWQSMEMYVLVGQNRCILCKIKWLPLLWGGQMINKRSCENK